MLGAVCSFAFLLQARSKWDEATLHYEYALEGYNEAFGPQHPDVFRIMNNLAACLQANGRLDEAEPIAQKAYDGCLAWLGPESEDTLVAQRNLHQLQRSLRRMPTEDSSPEFTDSLAKTSSCGSIGSGSSAHSSCRTSCTTHVTSTLRGSKASTSDTACGKEVEDSVSEPKDLDFCAQKLGPSTLESIRGAPHLAAVQVWFKKTSSMDIAEGNGHRPTTPQSRALGIFDCLHAVLGFMAPGCWIGHQANRRG